MKKLLIIVVFAIFGWQIYGKLQNSLTTSNREVVTSPNRPISEPEPSAQFKCDGRIHCSQMTSCEESKFFLRNCPDVKMDGNNDGIPCEKQWCN
jgi:hypothetical protein